MSKETSERLVTAVGPVTRTRPCGCMERDGVLFLCAAHSREVHVVKAAGLQRLSVEMYEFHRKEVRQRW